MYGNATAKLQPSLFDEAELDELAGIKKPVLKYFPEPKNDNEKLFNLQKQFLESGDKKYFWEMWLLSRHVARNLIIKEMQKKRKKLDESELEEKIEDTCEYLLRRFFTRSNYCVTTNFIIALRDSMRHALYYRTKLDKATCYIDDVFNTNNI